MASGTGRVVSFPIYLSTTQALDAGVGIARIRRCAVLVLSLVRRLPGFLWRHRRSVAVAALVAPLALTGSLELFAVNAVAAGFLGFTILKALKSK